MTLPSSKLFAKTTKTRNGFGSNKKNISKGRAGQWYSKHSVETRNDPRQDTHRVVPNKTSYGL